MDEENFEKTFEDTLKGSLPTISFPPGNYNFEDVYNDDIAKSLPFVGPIIKTAGLGIKIQDRLFAKKVASFLTTSSEVDEQTRQKMIEKIGSNQKYETKVGETILNLIERSRDAENARKIAVLFNAFLEEKLDYDDFLKCAEIVISVSDGGLRDFITKDYLDISEGSMDELLYSGLYRISISPIKISVQDDEDIEKERELATTKQIFQVDILNKYSNMLEALGDSLQSTLGKTLPPFGKFPNEKPSKYHVERSGGNLEVSKSYVGGVIQRLLSDYYSKMDE